MLQGIDGSHSFGTCAKFDIKLILRFLKLQLATVDTQNVIMHKFSVTSNLNTSYREETIGRNYLYGQ